jgi:hypothetical protein
MYQFLTILLHHKIEDSRHFSSPKPSVLTATVETSSETTYQASKDEQFGREHVLNQNAWGPN